MGPLSGKTALVTGGSHGIGREIALALAREGADVAIGYLSDYDRGRADSDAASVVDALRFLGRKACAVDGDVSDEDSVRRMFGVVQATLEGVDILVNNAGFVSLSAVEDMTVETWDRMVAVHLRGTFLVTRAALPHMLSQRSGRVINMASQIGQVGREHYAHYAAAKGGIIAFTKALSREVAGRGVLVNCIAPGPVRTGIVPLEAGSPPDRQRYLPLERVAEPSEIAPTAVFLASEASSFYVGQTLGPNGGDVML
jgi:3-oxoacyl-[acyl-carrier protein] reductase